MKKELNYVTDVSLSDLKKELNYVADVSLSDLKKELNYVADVSLSLSKAVLGNCYPPIPLSFFDKLRMTKG